MRKNISARDFLSKIIAGETDFTQYGKYTVPEKVVFPRGLVIESDLLFGEGLFNGINFQNMKCVESNVYLSQSIFNGDEFSLSSAEIASLILNKSIIKCDFIIGSSKIYNIFFDSAMFMKNFFCGFEDSETGVTWNYEGGIPKFEGAVFAQGNQSLAWVIQQCRDSKILYDINDAPGRLINI